MKRKRRRTIIKTVAITTAFMLYAGLVYTQRTSAITDAFVRVSVSVLIIFSLAFLATAAASHSELRTSVEELREELELPSNAWSIDLIVSSLYHGAGAALLAWVLSAYIKLM